MKEGLSDAIASNPIDVSRIWRVVRTGLFESRAHQFSMLEICWKYTTFAEGHARDATKAL
jgi:hypothetical protein